MGVHGDVQYAKQEAASSSSSSKAAAVAQHPQAFHAPPPSNRPAGRKWIKQWVPFDTVLNPGKGATFKWVNDDMMKSFKDHSIEPEAEPEEEYEVLYLCNFEGCGKAFGDHGSLRKHSNVHGEKQFICHYEGCGKRFMDSSKLKRHFLIHTGERPFVCPVDGCGKAFSLDFNLRSHMRTHTQENYHICPFEDCRKRYAHEYKLRAHLRTCHDKVVPPDVKLSLMQQPPPPVLLVERELPKTANATSGSVNLERPYACPYEGCDKRYIHEYKLNLHLRKEHAQEENAGEAPRAGRRSDADHDMDDGNGNVGGQGSGRGKLRIIAKGPSAKLSRRKPVTTPAPPPVSITLKVQRPPNIRQREAPKKEVQVDSEETEEEDQEDTEDEDLGRMMQPRTGSEDDEETEDDMD